MTRVAKPPIELSIEAELADLVAERYRSPLARLRVRRVLRRRLNGWPAAGEARELGYARAEEAAYGRLTDE
jgi:hypothetical protein